MLLVAAGSIPEPRGDVVSSRHDVLRVERSLDSGKSSRNIADDFVNFLTMIVAFAVKPPEEI